MIPSRRLYAGSAMDFCPRRVTSDKVYANANTAGKTLFSEALC